MANFLKKGDERIQAGHFDQPTLFFTPKQTQDAAGGELRTPTIRSVQGASPDYFAWTNVQPYTATITEVDRRLAAETWSLISMRYARSRIPKAGMLLQLKLTSEIYEIRGVDHVSFNRKKIELTCRLIV